LKNTNEPCRPATEPGAASTIPVPSAVEQADPAGVNWTNACATADEDRLAEGAARVDLDAQIARGRHRLSPFPHSIGATLPRHRHV